jgi:hypothetical protein
MIAGVKLKREDQQALRELELLTRQIERGVAVGDVESPGQKGARIKRLLSDYNAFVRYYFPKLASCDCAEWQLEWVRRLTADRRFYGVQEWPRGHAKTFTSAIMVPMWLMARGELKMMALIGRNENMATMSMLDLMTQLEQNQRYVDDFGPQVSEADWKPWQFTTRGGVRFVAFGLGQNPRGTRNEHQRPDYILVDDVDDEKHVGNRRLVSQAVDKLEAAVYGTMDMGRGRFVIAGNRIHNDGVLARFAAKATGDGPIYHSRVTALMVGPDGREVPAWPQKYTVEEVKQTMAMMSRRKARQEYLNEPDVDGQVFHESQIVHVERALSEPRDGMLCYIDPSYTKNGDYKAAVLLSRHGRQYHVHEVYCRRSEVRALVAWVYRLAERLRDRHRCDFYLDGSAQQGGTWKKEFEHYGQSERGWVLPLVVDQRETRGRKANKIKRIAEMAAYFERKEVSFATSLESQDDFIELKRQLLGFTGARNQADDGPDALESALSLLRVRSGKAAVHFIPDAKKYAE